MNSRDQGLAIGEIGIIDKDERGVRILLEIKDMESARSRFEFNHPRLREDLENTPAILAVVGYLKI